MTVGLEDESGAKQKLRCENKRLRHLSVMKDQGTNKKTCGEGDTGDIEMNRTKPRDQKKQQGSSK